MVKIGLIGCGRIAKNHFDAITGIEDARAVACCDIIAERAQTAADIYGIPAWTTSYEEILNNPEIDLVAICTPSGLHPEHGIRAARAGKHVLTEKPMGVKLADADRLIAECDRMGVRLFVMLQNRLNPAVQMTRRAFEEGRFGRIYMIVANTFWTRPQDYYDMAPWRGTWEYDGGAFMNQASHIIDLVQWFGGTVESVVAQLVTLDRNIEAEDTGVAAVRFKNGAVASINVTMLTYPRNLESCLTIMGEKGTVRIGGIAQNTIEHWKFADERDYDREIKKAETRPESVYGFGHQAYYQNMIECLAGRASQNVDGRAGRRSLELIEGIYRSSTGGAAVRFPWRP